jgi:putative endonuclease
MDKTYVFYILASRSRNLYTGVTKNLQKRLVQHRDKLVPGFTSRCSIFRQVHFEVYNDIRSAIAREKEIKAWRREKKIRLIERENPIWEDLSAVFFENKKNQQAKCLPSEKTKAQPTADPSLPSKDRQGSG